MEGLSELQRLGFVTHLPPVENIFPVSAEHFSDYLSKRFHMTTSTGGSFASDYSIAKSVVIDALSRELQEANIEAVFKFSDDNMANVEKISRSAQRYMSANDPRYLRIFVEYTVGFNVGTSAFLQEIGLDGKVSAFDKREFFDLVRHRLPCK